LRSVGSQDAIQIGQAQRRGLADTPDGDVRGRIGIFDGRVEDAVRVRILLGSGVVLPFDIRLVADQPERTRVRGRVALNTVQIGRVFAAKE